MVVLEKTPSLEYHMQVASRKHGDEWQPPLVKMAGALRMSSGFAQPP